MIAWACVYVLIGMTLAWSIGITWQDYAPGEFAFLTLVWPLAVAMFVVGAFLVFVFFVADLIQDWRR